MEFLEKYWPLLLVALFIVIRKLRFYQVKKQLPALKAAGAVLLDVRSEAEFAAGHAEGSINIPLDQLKQQLHRLAKDQTIVLACASGTRSAMANRILRQHGHKQTFNIGSWRNLQ
jgi:phage shock protein E